MKVDHIYCWYGLPPEGFRGEGPFEITMEDLEQLYVQYDVLFTHIRQPQPTKQAQRGGEPIVPDVIGLWLDEKGGKFRQR